MPRRRVEWVCRGRAPARQGDDLLIDLVPKGEWVPRRHLESLLADSYIGDCAGWSWTVLGDGAWPAVQFYSIAARREVESAIEDGVLAAKEVSSYAESSLLEHICSSFLRRFRKYRPPIGAAGDFLPHH